MPFSSGLDDDQQQFKNWLHGFAETVLRPAAAEWDEREATPWPIIQEAAKLGVYGWDVVSSCLDDPTGLSFPIYNEELAWGDPGLMNAITTSNLPATAIRVNGTDEQQRTWLPECFGTAAEPHLAAFCVSEPDAGSDVAALRTRAVHDEASGDWLLTGQKMWISNGGIADVHVVVATVAPELGVRGHATFVVGRGTPGLSMGSKLAKHGIRASHTAEVVLENCRVPGSALLGGKDALDERLAAARAGRRLGKQAALQTFEAFRPAIGAASIGVARAAYEYALEYAGQRVQFGRPIIHNQAIAFSLADMATEIDAARLLCWRASWMAAQAIPFRRGEASMAKLKASEVAVRVTEEAMHVLGGYGYVREFPVERWCRDAKIYPIIEGTSEVQRLVIARSLSGAAIR